MGPEHAWLQHIPSSQKPEAQWVGSAHASPSASGVLVAVAVAVAVSVAVAVAVGVNVGVGVFSTTSTATTNAAEVLLAASVAVHDAFVMPTGN